MLALVDREAVLAAQFRLTDEAEAGPLLDAVGQHGEVLEVADGLTGLDRIDHVGRALVRSDPEAVLVLVLVGQGLPLRTGLDGDGLDVQVVERLDVAGFEHAELDTTGEVRLG